ncbi:MAG: radical SAM family heme chaperone HemW [Saprospiraceae bacterium]
MAGIYVHIPYCRQKCSYCNFYFSVNPKTKKAFLSSLLKEIEIVPNIFKNEKLNSLYFGGGTPSILNYEELSHIINKIKEKFSFETNAEVTLEANPDDITLNYIDGIKKASINRLSIGIQSFNDVQLTLLNRNHNAKTAINAIKNAKKGGISNLNIDLIFGIPYSNLEKWQKNLDIFLDLDIDHLSCYNLTVENKTALYHDIKSGKIPMIDEEMSAEIFLYNIEYLQKYGYEHYEISNFARNQKYAIHNTSYWQREKYIGLGPSAHSYDGEKRYWNVANARKYIESINNNKSPQESESLNIENKFNEYIMTGLRTMWGIDSKEIDKFGNKIKNNFYDKIGYFIDTKMIVEIEGNYTLSKKGKLYADNISSDLFI